MVQIIFFFFSLSAFRIVRTVDIFTENCEDISKGRGQWKTPSLLNSKCSQTVTSCVEVFFCVFLSIQAQQPPGVSAARLEMSAPSVRESTGSLGLYSVRYNHRSMQSLSNHWSGFVVRLRSSRHLSHSLLLFSYVLKLYYNFQQLRKSCALDHNFIFN